MMVICSVLKGFAEYNYIPRHLCSTVVPKLMPRQSKKAKAGIKNLGPYSMKIQEESQKQLCRQEGECE
jgi:hypothetical protein